MELNKCEFLSILGLKPFKEVKKIKSNFVKEKVNADGNRMIKESKRKFKLNSFVYSFPITTIKQNSFLSNKFGKQISTSSNHILSYEKFCQTSKISQHQSSNKMSISSNLKC